MRNSSAKFRRKWNALRTLDERRATVLASISEQGKLTAELEEKINQAVTVTALEDLYAPYKPKRRTRASIAREKGLQGLAEFIIKQSRTPGNAEKTGAGVPERAGTIH